MTCCDEVTISTTNTAVSTYYTGTYTYDSADDLVGDRKVYKKDDACIYWFADNKQWIVTGCDQIGTGAG